MQSEIIYLGKKTGSKLREKMINILHVINNLEVGGAEMMLYKLLAHSTDKLDSIAVVSLKYKGDVGKRIEKLGFKVFVLDISRGKFSYLKAILKYRRLINKLKPKIIMSWMYHSNFFSFMFSSPRNYDKLVFNIRHSLNSLRNEKITTVITIKLNAWFSYYVPKVVNNSKQSIEQHNKFGFDRSKNIYIPNGFLLDTFKPDNQIYNKFRKKYDIAPSTKIVGNLARFHPMKNHIGLLEIFSEIKEQYSKPLKLVMGGRNIVLENAELYNQINALGLNDDCILLGEVNSSEILPAFDIYISSSSWGEGFPNVIGEALACGVPCVTTDVGDCRLLVNDYGLAYDPSDIEGLASGVLYYLLNNEKEKIQEKAHQYIQDNYSIASIIKQYEELYSSLVI